MECIRWVESSLKSQGNRWLFLDAVRGIAAFAVVLQHVLWFLSPKFEDFFATFWSPGRFGVVAFFIVSGFIVPRSLEQKGDVKGFWISRFFRLYPTYWFGLLFIGLLPTAGLIVQSNANPTSVVHWLANLTMLQSVMRIPDMNPVAWTLGLELVLYAAITFAYLRGFLHKTWLISLSLLVALGGSSILVPTLLHIRFPSGAAAVFASIIAGLALYRWFSGTLSKGSALAINALCLGVTVVSALINYSPTRLLSDPLQPTQFNAIFSAFTGYVFFLLLLKFRDIKFPKVFLWLGKVSYSLYLLHPIALALVPHGIHPFLRGALEIGLSLGFAWFGYECIEAPSIEMAKKILAKRQTKTIVEHLPARKKAA